MRVDGGDDGPIINTLEVNGENYSRQQEESASTDSSSDKLTVRVTDVSEQ
ncbi:hypothetical protein [Actinopolymorpha rutila]|uniref:Uncharacterized protein n=1 Tax=Actinopolymorpha rutila TaxID=446787 RepID=A0A852ZL72_9ACTN|nr:hypothetical protein [Actinopolymorpha rutila]NYH92973.1 hypothetical protein [Actinopolymorpha rutila]